MKKTSGSSMLSRSAVTATSISWMLRADSDTRSLAAWEAQTIRLT
nr:hypothetical protein [Methylobacterium sp. B34]